MAEGILGGLLGGEEESPEAQASGESRPTAEAFAAALASDHAKYDPEVAAAAAAFLRDQSRLLQGEADELEEQRPVRLKHLHGQSREGYLRRIGQRLRIGIQVFTIGVATAIAVGLAILVWSAANDHSLVVEPFRTPPELAQRGYDGQVVASRMLDHLNEMQNSYANKFVALHSTTPYSAESTREVKVEIPETGVSIGDLRRFLSDWLGHQTHISGSVVRDGSNLSVTSRVEGEARTFTGPDTDLDHLVQQAAEQVFATTQPFAYAEYLRNAGRKDDAIAIYRRLSHQGSPRDRAWAYVGWGETLAPADPQGAIARYREAGQLNPHLWLIWDDLARAEQFGLQDEEASVPIWRKAVAATDFGGAVPVRARYYHIQDEIFLDERLGDYHDGLIKVLPEADQNTDPVSAYSASGYAAWEAAYDHDNALATLWIERNFERGDGIEDEAKRRNRQLRLTAWQLSNIDDWNGAADALHQSNTPPPPPVAKPASEDTAAAKASPASARSDYFQAQEQIALARAGRLVEAEAIGATLPARCDLCRIAAAITASRAGDVPASERIFAAAVTSGPSQPHAATYAGAERLRRGDRDGAIAMFAIAHARGPHFADPIEMWGEALMAKGDLKGALGKFKEADRYAPHWGRNHLRWAQALAGLGQRDEARRQAGVAAALDLSVADRAALASLRT